MVARAIISGLMKGCRAAALVLFGWYLLTPPVVPSGTEDRWNVEVNAPLGRWGIYSSYDTARECTAAQGELQVRTAKERKKFDAGEKPFTDPATFRSVTFNDAQILSHGFYPVCVARTTRGSRKNSEQTRVHGRAENCSKYQVFFNR